MKYQKIFSKKKFQVEELYKNFPIEFTKFCFYYRNLGCNNNLNYRRNYEKYIIEILKKDY